MPGCAGLNLFARPPTDAGPHIYFWRVTAPDSDAPDGWIFGGLETDTHGDRNLDRQVVHAFQVAETLAVPIDVSVEGASRGLLWSSMLPKGENLAQLLGASIATDAVANLANQGIPERVGRRLEPWFAWMAIGQAQHNEAAAWDAERSKPSRSSEARKAASAGRPRPNMIATFLHLARGSKRIVELETVRQHTDALRKLDDETVAKMIATLLNTPTRKRARGLNALEDAYHRGADSDVQRMLLDLRGAPENATSIRQHVFIERNQHMAKRLARAFNSDAQVFAAVGVGHVLGAEGIPALLRDAGFEVTRISPTEPIVSDPRDTMRSGKARRRDKPQRRAGASTGDNAKLRVQDFQVSLPGNPSFERRNVPDAKPMRMASAKRRGVGFSMVVMEDVEMPDTHLESFYNSFVKGSAAELNLSLQKSRLVRISGVPAMAATARSAKHVARLRVALIGKRVYQLLVMLPKNYTSAQNALAKRVLNSLAFELQ